MNQNTEQTEVVEALPERTSIEDEIGYFSPFLSIMYILLLIGAIYELIVSHFSPMAIAFFILQLGAILLHRYFSRYLSLIKEQSSTERFDKVYFKWLTMGGYVFLTALSLYVMSKTSFYYGSWYMGIQTATIIPFWLCMEQVLKKDKKEDK